MQRPRVLVADDSRTMRDTIAALLAAEGIEVVGRAEDGGQALAMAASLRPDVITLDVNMPVLDGLSAAERIMSDAPARIIVVCAVGKEAAAELSFRALQAGALELFAKPVPGEAPREWGRRLAETVRLMAEVPVVRRRRAGAAPAAWLPAPGRSLAAFGIVASTGGPQALARLLKALPARLQVPLLLAQHVAAGFTGGLARWLATVSPVPVVTASDGERWARGSLHLPPDGHDLTVAPGGALRVTPSAREGPTPSGDALLESLARALGARAGGAVLTGMGEDGARGLLAVRQAGGLALAQDEGSCAVYGMPRAAFELGAAERVASPEEIGAAIVLGSEG